MELVKKNKLTFDRELSSEEKAAIVKVARGKKEDRLQKIVKKIIEEALNKRCWLRCDCWALRPGSL